MSRYQKGKTKLEQETVSGSSISWGICNYAPSSRQITTPAPTTQFFYRHALPAAQPTASKHWRLMKILVIIWFVGATYNYISYCLLLYIFALTVTAEWLWNSLLTELKLLQFTSSIRRCWKHFCSSTSQGGSVADWLACWTQAQKAPVQIAVTTLSGNCLRQTAHTHCASVHLAEKLVAALLRVAGVTAGLAESNGSLPPGLCLVSPAGWLPWTDISSGTLCSVIPWTQTLSLLVLSS